MNPKQRLIVGDGPPPEEMSAKVGERYRDRDSGRIYELTTKGWVKLAHVGIDVLLDSKRRWVQTAQDASLSLEDWITRTLDGASR